MRKDAIYDGGEPITLCIIYFGEGSVADISIKNIAKSKRENGKRLQRNKVVTL